MDRVPRSERVYDALKRDILGGQLPPGAALREEEVSRSHKVSRTPVREALNRLETEGLARRHPRLGMVVSTPTLDEIVDLYVVREALEGLAARLATERRTELDLTRLDIVVEAAEREMADPPPPRVFELGDEFHTLIWRMSGNPSLQTALRNIEQAIRRFQPKLLSDPGYAERSVHDHRDLLEHVRARNALAAERSAIDHVRQVRNARIAMSLGGPAATLLAAPSEEVFQ